MWLYPSADDRPLSARELRGDQGRTDPRHASAAFGGAVDFYGRANDVKAKESARGVPVMPVMPVMPVKCHTAGGLRLPRGRASRLSAQFRGSSPRSRV